MTSHPVLYWMTVENANPQEGTQTSVWQFRDLISVAVCQVTERWLTMMESGWISLKVISPCKVKIIEFCHLPSSGFAFFVFYICFWDFNSRNGCFTQGASGTVRCSMTVSGLDKWYLTGCRQYRMAVVRRKLFRGKHKVQVSINNKPLTSASLTCGGVTMQDY